jgi:calcineurin-like phosphoesterase family protein
LAALLATVVLLTLLATHAAVAAASDPVLAAAGDIACAAGDRVNDCKQAETAQLIESEHPDALAPLGDNQYEWGGLSEFDGPGAYNETWGRFNSIAHPVPGNHEYETPDAQGYFDYFGPQIAGPAAGGGYYSYELGAWHIIALNSNCSDLGCQNSDTGVTSTPELSWLGSDLASHPNQCTLAYWHHPAFTSSAKIPDSPGVLGLWNLLYAAHADVVLNGHDHKYERFAQQDPAQQPTSAGIREFVVGTGGESLIAAGPPQPNLEVLDDEDFGVLFLTLHAYSYDWVFKSTTGAVLDSGTTQCHAQPPPPPPVPPPAPPPAPPPPPPAPEHLKFTASVKHVVRRIVLRRGLTVHVYCSQKCRVSGVTLLVKGRRKKARTIHFRYAKTIDTHRGKLRLKLKGIPANAHLTLRLTAVTPTGERRSATTSTLVKVR